MEVLRLLAAQYGVVTRQQALGCGLSSSAIGRRLESREWVSVLPGVYRHVAAPVSDLLMTHAAVLWLGPAAVLWGSWAAWWHELLPEPTGPVSLTVPRSAKSRSHVFVRVRRRDLGVNDVVTVRDVRVTSRALTALENAQLPGGHHTFDRALQRHVTVPDLDDTVHRMWHAYGVVRARSALAGATDGTVSPPERSLAAAFRRAGLTEIKAGRKVVVDGSLYWLDFSVEEVKLVIEVDGIRVHSDPVVFEKDRRKQNVLVRDGWTMLRYTPWQIRNEIDAVIAEVCSTLAGFGVIVPAYREGSPRNL